MQVQNLTITLNKDLRTLVHGLSFTLGKGDKVAVIGEEGDGKSTLLKLIFDKSLAPYASYTGTILKQGKRPGYLAQELFPGENSLSAFEYLSRRSGAPEAWTAAAAELGLSPGLLKSDRPVSTLSGGERVKLQLAAILAEQPDFLLLDEPSNDLDLSALEWLERFINRCGLPVLYVSHDETLLERTANAVIHLEQLRRKTNPRCTVARTPYRQYVSERLAGIVRQEQVARKERSEFEKRQERWGRLYQKVDQAQAQISRQDPHGGQLLKKKMKSVKAAGKRFDREAQRLPLLPEAENAIALTWDNCSPLPIGKNVLDLDWPGLKTSDGTLLSGPIRLTIKGGDHICIVGGNGAGKSTLLRHVTAELLPRSDLKTAYMPQDYGELLDLAQTPAGFLTGGRTDRETLTMVRTRLGSMKYTADEMNRPAAELSGGQKAKLLLLKTALDGCNVLILDEPSRNFSPMSAPVVREALKRFPGTIISVSHDRKWIQEVCSRVYRLTEQGLIQE